MHIRTRKLIGTFALLALVTVWALLAMAFAQFALRAQSDPRASSRLRATLRTDRPAVLRARSGQSLAA